MFERLLKKRLWMFYSLTYYYFLGGWGRGGVPPNCWMFDINCWVNQIFYSTMWTLLSTWFNHLWLFYLFIFCYKRSILFLSDQPVQLFVVYCFFFFILFHYFRYVFNNCKVFPSVTGLVIEEWHVESFIQWPQNINRSSETRICKPYYQFWCIKMTISSLQN